MPHFTGEARTQGERVMSGIGGTPVVSDGHAGSTRATTLRDYLRVARRRKWIIAQAVVLVPLVAVALSLHQRTMYRGSAEVLLATQNVANQLNGINDPTLLQDADRRAQTQADLARVPDVARQALTLAGLRRSVDDFLSHSSATAKTNADLLELSGFFALSGAARYCPVRERQASCECTAGGDGGRACANLGRLPSARAQT